jgi:hypothetical protein
LWFFKNIKKNQKMTNTAASVAILAVAVEFNFEAFFAPKTGVRCHAVPALPGLKVRPNVFENCAPPAPAPAHLLGLQSCGYCAFINIIIRRLRLQGYCGCRGRAATPKLTLLFRACACRAVRLQS